MRNDNPEVALSKRSKLALNSRSVSVAVQRSKLHRQIHETSFWKYWDKRKAMHDRLSRQMETIAHALTSKHFAFARVPTSYVIDQTVLVFPDLELFGFLQSTFHEVWSLAYGATLEDRPRYSLTSCFRTFPFPEDVLEFLETRDERLLAPIAKTIQIADDYHVYRQELMLRRVEGLNGIYNRFHDQQDFSEDVVQLRERHSLLNSVVAESYGWSDLDLDLGHGFHETKQGTRFTISDAARREILTRLLKLNHERHAEEVAQGLHDKKKGKSAKASRKSKGKASSEPSLFGEED